MRSRAHPRQLHVPERTDVPVEDPLADLESTSARRSCQEPESSSLSGRLLSRRVDRWI
jgi:hypothetical protein